MINTFAGEKIQTVQDTGVSKKGKHTTTNPVLYKLKVDKNSIIEFIDIPGIREFGLQHKDLREVQAGYIEFDNFDCQLEDCKHENEPNCGVKDAIENNLIPKFRYRIRLSRSTSAMTISSPIWESLDQASTYS